MMIWMKIWCKVETGGFCIAVFLGTAKKLFKVQSEILHDASALLDVVSKHWSQFWKKLALILTIQTHMQQWLII